RSPYAFKVMVMIAEKGIACDVEAAAASSAEVAEVNPLCKVPVLIRDDGKSLYDSSVIIDYLDGVASSPKLIPDAFEDRIEVRRWEALGNGIMDAAVGISHADRLPAADQDAQKAKQQKKIDAGLAAMAKDLGDRDFCQGDSFTLADIACGCALVCIDIRRADMDWRQTHPALARHAERMASRQSFKTAGSSD
ncbi:MAG: glutathione S-transferase N-terminal domain-containing protein, partial [Proteobacteria bacterium]|nr:glutathione S-transferase N-terminal domain-containing protein [Pseudomonadota bacterium]